MQLARVLSRLITFACCATRLPLNSEKHTPLSSFFCRFHNNKPSYNGPKNTMADTEELNELFATPNTQLQQDVLAELQSTLRILSISPQELFFKWEAYSLKMGSENTRMDYKTARDFKKDLQDALERESRGKAHMQNANKRTMAATPRNANTGDVFGVYVFSLLP